MKKSGLRKKVSVKNVLIFLVLIFAVWNLSWYLITTIKYHEFVEAVPKNELGVHVKKEGGYTFNVKKPGYLHFTGNLGVSKQKSMDGLIIWPQILGGYKYGVRIQDDGEVFEIYVDENMDPINKGNAATVKEIKQHEDKIKELFSKSEEMWPGLK